MAGYGVLVTQRQLDEAEGESGGSPTRLIRNLLSIFFSREELARSSCYGSRANASLDRDVVSACISKDLVILNYMCMHAVSISLSGL